jgi:hypothetical protein
MVTHVKTEEPGHKGKISEKLICDVHEGFKDHFKKRIFCGAREDYGELKIGPDP